VRIQHSEASEHEAPALDMENLSKSFGGVRVLHGASVSVAVGQIHALVGQNGSGKSTLIKLLAGFHTPDVGGAAAVRVLGRPMDFGSPASAHELGLRFVHQDLALADPLSITENIMLGRSYPRQGPRIRWSEAHDRATALMERVGVQCDVRLPVYSFSRAERTAVAIARSLPEPEHGRAVVVLDEPTASLPAPDVSHLFSILRTLRSEGHTIVIVTHHIDEIMDLADTITVLRDGRVITTTPAHHLDEEKLTRLIVGYDLEVRHSTRRIEKDQPPVLELRGVSGGTVRDVSVSVAKGEVVGVAGLTGSGREMLAALVTGRVPGLGQVKVRGKVIPSGSPSAAMQSGMTWVQGERERFGVFRDMSVRENTTISSLRRHVRGPRLSRRSEREEVTSWIDRLSIVCNGTEALISHLSGGNQQKVLVARALRLEPEVLVLEDATFGIDVGAREQVHSIIDGIAAEGVAVLVTSTDSGELVRIADRVIVLRNGTVTAELRRGEDLTSEMIDLIQLGGLPTSSEVEPHATEEEEDFS
jgi:ribose transport system ATP-binding protein